MVVKKDGRREKFDRQKIVHGVMRACEKRPVTGEQLEELTSSVESALRQKNRNEIPVAEIGERILDSLRSLDEVAATPRFTKISTMCHGSSRSCRLCPLIRASQGTTERP